MIWCRVTCRAPCQLLCESLGFAHTVTRWSLSHQVLQAMGTINKDGKRGESAPKASCSQGQRPLCQPPSPLLLKNLRSQLGSVRASWSLWRAGPTVPANAAALN